MATVRNDLLNIANVIAVIALVGSVIWFGWMRKQYAVLGAISAVIALGTLLASANHLKAAVLYLETPMLLFFTFEASLNIALLALLAVFSLTFRLN